MNSIRYFTIMGNGVYKFNISIKINIKLYFTVRTTFAEISSLNILCCPLIEQRKKIAMKFLPLFSIIHCLKWVEMEFYFRNSESEVEMCSGGRFN